jgi:hypothetical protein
MICNKIIQVSLNYDDPVINVPYTELVPYGIVNDKILYLVEEFYVFWDGTQWVVTDINFVVQAVLTSAIELDCPFDPTVSETTWTTNEQRIIDFYTKSEDVYEEYPCSCDILINYTITTEKESVQVLKLLSPAGVLAGHSYYTWEETIDGEAVTLLLYFNTEQLAWIIVVTSPTTTILFGLMLAGLEVTTPCPIPEGENNWSGFSRLFDVISTDTVCETSICTPWESFHSASTLPAAYRDWIFEIKSYPNPETILPGQQVTYLSFKNPPVEPGVGGYKVAAVLWESGGSYFYQYTPGRNFKGIGISDANNTILQPNQIADLKENSGNLCLAPLVPPIPGQDTENPEDCYSLLVWNKQCEFAKCVYSYLQQLQFGTSDCKTLDKLLNEKRALEILNCYDTRDIENDTTDYNFITYNQIKNLLNH